MFSHPVYLFLREFSLQDSRGGSDTLPERLVRQTLFRANRLLMEAYTEILELDACFKD
ncbi:hypothetical protein [Escherichia coli]|uniref:hypothetical protein n=1 Tax=Escherichia coli TaxID=562 RepID=UPI001FCD3618|nr:hypothetical protein [Escherichia coli]